MTPGLLETMRADGGRIALWERHRARLSSSAAAWGIPFDPDSVDPAVEAAITRREGVHSVRLVLHPDGRPAIEASPFDERPLRTAWVCPDPFDDAGGPLCRHKTTERAHYERPYHAARQQGADEAILVSPSGAVVEGTRTSVWVEREGRLFTPPLTAGGLPGVMRAHLLATRDDTDEAPLTPADLRAADAVWLSNALRGLMRVRLVEGPRAEP